MVRYIANRIFTMVLTLWVIITLTFFLMHAIPGDPFDGERITSEVVRENMMKHYNLDKPIMIQYVIYLKSLLSFDFGPSINSPMRSINDMIAEGFPISAQLGLGAFSIALVAGITLGIIAALWHNKLPDYISMILAVIGISIPSFIMATILVKYFAVKWGILPVATWDTWQHTILPTVALSFGPMAIIARLMRSSMLEVLNQEFIQTAKSKGLNKLKVVIRHAIRNSIFPVVTISGPLFAGIVTGSFVIERIFAIPGMGKFFVDSITNRDYPVILGTTIFYSMILVISIFIVDILYVLIDPRIKLHGKEAA
ncbi:peptide/nickel transport system permease protein [Paenibacillus sp. yr247]|uniref:ABC transporter permease n=1 Tax=Paenibacillus sp. yr247 TaxID=1761880 RepID=UPI00087F51D1|nr:ABC transporter permease [Paenibacillus sp. yr247]SDP13618.1 peptide/nickel transport system permease protein [Paenibacillus sp. yr247]